MSETECSIPAAPTDSPLTPYVFFETEDNAYAYDANTNQIARMDPTAMRILQDFLRVGSGESTIDTSPREFGASSVGQVLDELHELKRQGMFKSELEFPVALPLTESQILRELRTRLDTLLLEVTQSCNLRCRYCTYSGAYAFQRVHSNRKMPTTIVQRALQVFSARSAESDEINIGFYGGEPLLNMEAIRHATELSKDTFKNTPLTFSITTNGTLIDEGVADFLITNDFVVHVSLDGPPPLNDRWRVDSKGNGSYSQVLRGVGVLRDKDPDFFRTNVGFQATITPPYPYSEVLEFFEAEPMLAESGLLAHLVNRFETTIDFGLTPEERDVAQRNMGALQEAFVSSVLAGRRGCKLGFALFENGLRKIAMRTMGKPRYQWVNGICIPGRAKLFVNVDGMLFMCEKVGNAFPLGTVDQGITEKTALGLIEKYCDVSSEDCRRCWCYRLCSLCFASMCRGSTFDLAKKRRYCEDYRSYMARMLVLYCRIMEINPHALDYLDRGAGIEKRENTPICDKG